MKFSNIASTVLLSASIAVSTTGCDSKEDRERKYLERAQEQIEQGDLVKARLEIRNALQINNKSAEALYLRALVFEKEQLWRKMMDELNAAVTTDPTYMPAQMKRVTYFYGFGPQGDAMTTATLESMLEIDPENVEAIVLLGRIALRAGNVEDAIKQAELALSIDSTSIHPYALLGEIYKDDTEKALAYIEQGLQSNPGNEELILTRIQVFSQREDVDSALGEYERLIEAHPDNLDYARQMITYLSENNRAGDAERFLMSKIEGNPDVSEYKVWIIQLLLAANEQERAIALARKFITENTSEAQLYYLLSDVYLSLNQSDDAVETLEMLLKRLPDDSAEASKTRVRIAEVSLKAGDLETAQDHLASVLAADPENPSALILTAQLLLREGETEEAIINLRSALKREPDSFRARVALASAHEANGSADLALDSYQAALEIEPANVNLALKIARIYYDRSEYEAGNRLLQRYLVTEQTAAAVAPALVDSFVREEKWAQAREVIDALKAQEQNQSLGLYLEGGIYLEQGENSKAVSAFEALLEAEPESARALSAMVKAKVAANGPDAGIAFLQNYIEKHPGTFAAYSLKANMHAEAGQLADAVKTYEDALKEQPENLNIYLAISRLHQGAGDIQGAIEALDRATSIAPDNTNISILKAGLYESQQNYQEAISLYDEVLVANPTSAVAINNLAMLLVDHSQSDTNTSRALELTEPFENSNEPVLLDTRAWVHYSAGNFEQAAAILEKVVADPDKVIPTYQYHLGMAYLQLGEKARARDMLEASLQSEGTFSEREKAQAALDALDDQ